MIKVYKNITFIGLFLLLILANTYPLSSQSYTFTQVGIYYYNSLEKNEFFNFMLPRENFLLDLVESISTEIFDRGVKGELGAEIGIEEIIPREVVVMDNYEEEIGKIIALLDDIDLLEKKARQRVDLEILKMLSDLRTSVRKILEQNRVTITTLPDSTVMDMTTGNIDSSTGTPSQKMSGEKMDPELFNSWKYDRIFNYKLNLMKYKLLRNRLLNTSSHTQKQRMFRRYLHKALRNYEDGRFQLTRLQFKDIINTYEDYYLDDVLFYYGESCYGLNYLDEAASCYVKLFKQYPESSFLEKTFIKLIYIYYIYNNFDKMFAVYQNLHQHNQSINQADFNEVSYLVGYAFYKKGDYNKAIDILGNVSKGGIYYYPALYLAATCCSNIGRKDYTISLYKKICNEIPPETHNPMSLQIRNNAILKLGLIYFDQNKIELSEQYFNLIPEDFSQYDLSLLGKAWSAYQSGNPIETLENTQQLIRGNMLSQYSYEARLLAAYSKNILGRTEEAVEDLKTVYQVGQTPQIVKEQEVLYESDQSQNKTNKILNKLADIAHFLYSTNNKSSGLDPILKKLTSESDVTLRNKIASLDSLEHKATLLRDEDLKERIRRIRSRLLEVYKEKSKDFTLQKTDINSLTDNVDKNEYIEYYFSSLLNRILQEKQGIKEIIGIINNRIDSARQEDNYLGVSRAEIKLSELYAYYNKINQYEVWLRENYPEDIQVNLDQWAYYSGYGISDINFARIKQLDTRISEISYNIDALDNVYDKKQVNLEKQVEGLLNDVSRLEEQIQKESTRKMQKKREEFFNNKYFDKQLQESIIGEIEEHIGKIKNNEKE